MRYIKLMADYQCHPLWFSGPEQPGNIDPATLPLKAETVAALDAWSQRFDSWMDLGDPTSAQEPSADEVDAFERTGVELWRRLIEELSPEYQVEYKSIKLRKTLKHPDELKWPS